MKLLRVFKSCMSMRMVNQMNSVFACVSYSIHQENLEASRIILEEKKRKFGFESILNEVKIRSAEFK